jgi:hypothetical protein
MHSQKYVKNVRASHVQYEYVTLYIVSALQLHPKPRSRIAMEKQNRN